MISGAADTIDLTPQSMVPLAGFGKRHTNADRIADPIEANAVALRDADGRTAVIVSFDTLFVGPVMDAAIRTLLVGEGVRDADILLLASHTHYAPSLDPGKPKLGATDADYLEWAIGQCSTMLLRLLARPFRPLTLSHGEAAWDGAIHRRKRWPLPYRANGRFGWHEPAMAPEPNGPRDRRVRAWQLRAGDGETLAILWSCACHPTGFPRRNQLSAEYPGHIRAAIRDAQGPSTPVLFLQGFAGDVRQRSPETRPLLRRMAHTLRYGPSFCGFDASGWTSWAETLAGAVRNALATAAPVPFSGAIRSALATTPVSALLDVENAGRTIAFRRLTVGEQLDFWALGAEPSTDLKQHLPASEAVVPLGYLGDVFGYWPTAAQAAEGGYEGGGFIDAFGLSGRFRPVTDTVCKDMVERLKAERQ